MHSEPRSRFRVSPAARAMASDSSMNGLPLGPLPRYRSVHARLASE